MSCSAHTHCDILAKTCIQYCETHNAAHCSTHSATHIHTHIHTHTLNDAHINALTLTMTQTEIHSDTHRDVQLFYEAVKTSYFGPNDELFRGNYSPASLAIALGIQGFVDTHLFRPVQYI